MKRYLFLSKTLLILSFLCPFFINSCSRVETKEPENEKSFITKAGEFMIWPTNDSWSGVGASIVLVKLVDLKHLESYMVFFIPLALLASITGLLTLLFNSKLKVQKVFAFIEFVGLIFGLIVIKFLYQEKILWGFYLAIFLSFADVLMVYYMKKKQLKERIF